MQVWSPDDFYPPDYVSAEITMGPRQYREIHHSFAEIPTLLRVVGSFSDEGTDSVCTYVLFMYCIGILFGIFTRIFHLYIGSRHHGRVGNLVVPEGDPRP